jgi:uncharacterized protein (DUF2141 family)
MKVYLCFLFLWVCLSLPLQAQTVWLTVNGFNSQKGVCLACLYRTKEGFPTKRNKALSCINAKITGSSATLSFPNVPPGTYALAIVHDENSNGDMDTNFMGLPKEGYGISNNRLSRFGPPTFANAAFRVETGDVKLSITMQY